MNDEASLRCESACFSLPHEGHQRCPGLETGIAVVSAPVSEERLDRRDRELQMHAPLFDTVAQSDARVATASCTAAPSPRSVSRRESKHAIPPQAASSDRRRAGKVATSYALRAFPRAPNTHRGAQQTEKPLHLTTADHYPVGIKPRLTIRSAAWHKFHSARTVVLA